MIRSTPVLFALIVTLLTAGCGGSGSTNSGSELPEGINTQPVAPGATSTPGIPADANKVPENSSPTPGIPANSKEATSVPKGATPTPGIPDQETLRRQMGRPVVDPNVVNRPSGEVPNSNAKTRDQLGRPRKANSQ